ncbi:MAG: GNAT family N-acetyltransferase [Saprospiraceae bacterium]|nr:GNAT family N-acetyltransferase [Saprospiraceae bacterium]
MTPTIRFDLNPSSQEIQVLKNGWMASLTSAQDGMWESFRDQATYYGIKTEGALVGYACLDASHQLIQFYLTPSAVSYGATIFNEFIAKYAIHTAIVGTNNPTFLSLALDDSRTTSPHTYLFRNTMKVNMTEKAGRLHQAEMDELNMVVDFYHASIGAPIEWLNGYLRNHVHKGEVYYFKNKEEMIGACEVRKSMTNSSVSDIGMLVAPSFRKQGYGSYLLYKAKMIAIESGRTPICSCEKENIGSYKSITNAGFISIDRLLKIALD